MKLSRLFTKSTHHRNALLDKASREAESGRRLAMYDRETGLYASWYLELRFEEEAQRAERYGRPLSLISLEVRCDDGAYRIQDEVRNWLTASLRATDLASHLGGGRYLVVLTETAKENASIIATRIASEFVEDVAVGLACFPDDGESFEAVQDAAERHSHVNWRLAV